MTLVTLQRSVGQRSVEPEETSPAAKTLAAVGAGGAETWRVLGEFSIASEPGNERQAMQAVVEALQPLDLRPRRLEVLKTAVAEATMNAMEHGNQYQADRPVSITVLASDEQVLIRIKDLGGNRPIPRAETPDLEAKLAELQTPRGWGLFLIQSLVDDMRTTSDETHHTVELLINLKGDRHAEQAS